MPILPKKRNNPLKAWLKKRTEKEISNATHASTQSLIDALRSVDFIHGNLPDHVLNDRQDEEVLPHICTLEWDTRALIQLLQDDKQHITMDIRPIDEKLMILISMFTHSVACGDVMTAKLAMDALYCGVKEIRCKLPINQPELADIFVQANANYLSKWITLVKLAEQYDRKCEMLDTQEADLRRYQENREVQHGQFRIRCLEDPEFMEAVNTLSKVPPHEPAGWWTPAMHEAHDLLVVSKMNDFELEFCNRKIDSLRDELSRLEQEMQDLRTHLNMMPSVPNPNLMNAYHAHMVQPSADQNPLDEMSVGELAEALFGKERLQRILNHSDPTDS